MGFSAFNQWRNLVLKSTSVRTNRALHSVSCYWLTFQVALASTSTLVTFEEDYFRLQSFLGSLLNTPRGSWWNKTFGICRWFIIHQFKTSSVEGWFHLEGVGGDWWYPHTKRKQFGDPVSMMILILLYASLSLSSTLAMLEGIIQKSQQSHI